METYELIKRTKRNGSHPEISALRFLHFAVTRAAQLNPAALSKDKMRELYSDLKPGMSTEEFEQQSRGREAASPIASQPLFSDV